MTSLPYVTAAETARNRPLMRAGGTQAAVATLIAVAVVGAALRAQALSWERAAVLAGACLAITVLCGWRFRARAGGVTGDFLGAAQQLAECAVLLSLALSNVIRS
jgi:adenosylcobinamide-GDP ribazoletransferase